MKCPTLKERCVVQPVQKISLEVMYLNWKQLILIMNPLHKSFQWQGGWLDNKIDLKVLMSSEVTLGTTLQRF